MSPSLIFAVFAVVLVGGSLFYLFFYQNWRRRRALQQPFPEHWKTLLSEQLPMYTRLPEPQRERLEQLVQLFMDEKTFYGCDGFDVTDRIRLAIAGHACLLLLNRPFSHYDEIRSILIYPDVFRVQHAWEHGMIVNEGEEIRAGEASSYGQVVLAWSECEEPINDPDCPHNVILHEFAHQLDFLDGSADGAPPMSGEQADRWLEVMSTAYDDLQHAIEHHHNPWLDPYGASEPAEFFAVLTEAFFQQPRELHQAQPEVYGLLQEFYRLDPLAFTGRRP
ncbi:MAG: M90 family metallopeptidase [Pseudomonadota bacterium]|nr:M90 family metallopeptidase [Pseudomonadota bacterium]